jgi:hypothetical protein
MGGFMKKMGFNLEDDELYARAFQKGVLLNQYGVASDLFDKSAKRFTDKGNPLMATKASANALLYRYLITKDIQQVTPLLQLLLRTLQGLQQQGLQEIEAIGPSCQTESISIAELCAELDCRLVEVAILQAENDQLRSRDLHKIAADKFQAIKNIQLKTYSAVPVADVQNDKPIMHSFFHSGMFSYYEAMLKKNYDPSAASDDLSKANQSFRGCNNQKWQLTVTNLLNNWRVKRTCWICHRDMQGYELHFSMCHADVTPYAQTLLEKASQDSINVDAKQIAVCTPCGSMVKYKAKYEADIVRRELNAKLDNAMNIIQSLNERVNRLERSSHHH